MNDNESLKRALVRFKVIGVGIAILSIIGMMIIANQRDREVSSHSDVVLHLNMANSDTVDCTIEKAVGIYLKGEGVHLEIGDTITLSILYYRQE